MRRHAPIVFEWREVEVADPKTGEVSKALAMLPIERFTALAKREFEIGQMYRFGDVVVGGDVRSTAHHRRYFAALREAFTNLPEVMTARWPTVEHFRAWLLVETHWCLEKEIDCADEKNARRLALHCRTESPFARIVIATDPVTGKKTKVVIKVPMSQDYGSMDKDTFKQSSDAVLDLAAHFVQVPRGTLLKEAGRSA